jgi:putative hydrolase of the HAD superfamily
MKLFVKGLLFDYGGTIDTNGVHWSEVLWEAYERHHIPVTRAAFQDAYVRVERMLGEQPLICPEHTFRETLRIKLRLQFETLHLKETALAGQIAESCYVDTSKTILSASGTLSVLKERYPMILVSNFYGNLRTVLNEFNLADYFRQVIESAGAGVRKPDPALYAFGIRALGLQPAEIAVIGDSCKNDIIPANKLGCPSIWLKGKGWDDSPNETAFVQSAVVIYDFSELQTLL